MTTKIIKPTTAAMHSPLMSGCVKGGATLNSGVNRKGISRLSGSIAERTSRNCFHGLGGVAPSGVNQKSIPVLIVWTSPYDERDRWTLVPTDAMWRVHTVPLLLVS